MCIPLFTTQAYVVDGALESAHGHQAQSINKWPDQDEQTNSHEAESCELTIVKLPYRSFSAGLYVERYLSGEVS